MNTTLSHALRVLALGATVATPASAQLPDAKELVSRFVQASGGADLIRKHSSVHLSGTFEMPAQGISGTIEIWNADGRLLTVVEIPGIGSIRSGYDGETAWQIHPALGASVMSGRQLDQMKQGADLLALITPEKYVKSRETIEKTTFDGKEVFKVKTVLVNGEEYFDLYDAQTHLAVGMLRTMESPMGAVETSTAFMEYQSFDGHKVPTKLKQTMMGLDQIITFTKVDLKPIDKATFDLPREIKALTGK